MGQSVPWAQTDYKTALRSLSTGPGKIIPDPEGGEIPGHLTFFILSITARMGSPLETDRLNDNCSSPFSWENESEVPCTDHVEYLDLSFTSRRLGENFIYSNIWKACYNWSAPLWWNAVIKGLAETLLLDSTPSSITNGLWGLGHSTPHRSASVSSSVRWGVWQSPHHRDVLRNKR